MNTQVLTLAEPGIVHAYQSNDPIPVISAALHRASHGAKTLVAQLLKGGFNQGVDRPVLMSVHLMWLRPRIERCISGPAINSAERKAILSLWQYVSKNFHSYDLIVLDGIGQAIEYGLIPEDQLAQLLQQRCTRTDVVLIGNQIPCCINAEIDLWTRVK